VKHPLRSIHIDSTSKKHGMLSLSDRASARPSESAPPNQTYITTDGDRFRHAVADYFVNPTPLP